MRGSTTSLTYCPRPCVSRCRFGRGTDRPMYEFGRSRALKTGGESSTIFIDAQSHRNRVGHEIVEIDLGIWIERINVVHANEARRHVPLVRSRALVFLDDVGFRLVVGPEQLLVEIGVAIADRLVGKEA